MKMGPDETYRYFIIPANSAVLHLLKGRLPQLEPESVTVKSRATRVAGRILKWHRNYGSDSPWIEGMSNKIRWLLTPLILLIVVGFIIGISVALTLAGTVWPFAGKAKASETMFSVLNWTSLLLTGNAKGFPDVYTKLPDVEDVPDALAYARGLGYRIAIYEIPDASSAEQEKARELVAGGHADFCLQDLSVSSVKAFVQECRVNVLNSMLVLHNLAIVQDVEEVGFSPLNSNGFLRNMLFWQPSGDFEESSVRSEALQLGFGWSSQGHMLRHIARSLQRHLTAVETANLPPEVVVYLADGSDDVTNEVSAFINEHETYIRGKLAEKGIRLLLFGSENGEGLSLVALPALRYRYPTMRSISDDDLLFLLKEAATHLSLAEFSKALLAVLQLPHTVRPALIRHVAPDIDAGATTFSYSSLLPPSALDKTARRNWLIKSLNLYLERVSLQGSDVKYSLNKGPEEYDADWKFSRDGHQIPVELKAQLAALQQQGLEDMLAHTLLHIAGQLQQTRPDLLSKLAPLLFAPDSPRASSNDSGFTLPIPAPIPGPAISELSPLFIDSNYRFWLPAYSNLEIVLTPLPKVLYLFFLRHPEGLMFHDLIDHRAELEAYYKLLQPTVLLPTISERIRDLTDIRSNSVNEKCSRIKEAFVRHLDERIAAQYFVTGRRGEKKAISLPRHLLQWGELEQKKLLLE